MTICDYKGYIHLILEIDVTSQSNKSWCVCITFNKGNMGSHFVISIVNQCYFT